MRQTVKYMRARIAKHDQQMHALINAHEGNAWYAYRLGTFLYFGEHMRNYGATKGQANV